MAENEGSGGRAADIFVGVVDLFAIILPGALLALVVWTAAANADTPRWPGLTIRFPDFIPAWLLFLIGAYVLGHFIAALGAWCIDPLYDRYYKQKYERGAAKTLPALRDRATDLIRQSLGSALFQESDNRLTWGESFLLLNNAAATAKLDRQEADSKFFRSLAVVAILSELACFSPLTGWAPLPVWYFELAGFAILVAFVAVTRSKLTRYQVTLLPVLWFIYCAGTVCFSPDRRAWIVATLCWSLTMLSVSRFMSLRVKRLTLAYYLTIALHRSSAFGPRPETDSHRP